MRSASICLTIRFSSRLALITVPAFASAGSASASATTRRTADAVRRGIFLGSGPIGGCATPKAGMPKALLGRRLEGQGGSRRRLDHRVAAVAEKLPGDRLDRSGDRDGGESAQHA